MSQCIFQLSITKTWRNRRLTVISCSRGNLAILVRPGRKVNLTGAKSVLPAGLKTGHYM